MSSITQTPPRMEIPEQAHYRELLYGAYRSAHFGASNPDTEAARKSREESYARELARFLPADRNVRMLDAGCGSGFLLEFLHGQGYVNSQGVDASREQVEFCRGKGLPVEHADLLDSLESTKGWGLIFCTDVVEHLHKDEVVRFLEAAHAALAPGGRLVVRTGNAACIYGMYLRYIDFTHETFYTERSLSQLLLACGYSGVRIFDTVAPFGFRPKRLARWALMKVWRAGLRLALTLEAGTDAPRLMGKFLTAVGTKPAP